MLHSRDSALSHSEDSDDEVISFLAPQSAFHLNKKTFASFLESSTHPVVSSTHSVDEPSRGNGAFPSGDLPEAPHALASPPSSPLPVALGDKTILESHLEALFTEDPAHGEGMGGSTLPVCSYLLRRYLDIPGGVFRARQQEVCLSVLQGRRTLAVCPTGWGKSLCFQFPMLVHRLLVEARRRAWKRGNRTQGDEIPAVSSNDAAHRGGDSTITLPPSLQSKFCVVVSPLLSLMGDQAASIRRKESLRAFVLSSNVSAAAEGEFFKQLASPVSPYDLVFVSPEKFISSVRLRSLLKAQRHRLAMICVDEAHCISRWAYDFRPSFLYLHRILSEVLEEGQGGGGSFGEATWRPQSAAPASAIPTAYLCLTATATRPVVRDLEGMFAIQHTVCCHDQFRRNLRLGAVDVRRVEAERSGRGAAGGPPTTRSLQAALLDAVAGLPRPLLVYVASRLDADELAAHLAAQLNGKRARAGEAGTGPPLVVRAYHAGLSTPQRTATQREFLHDRVDVLVATVAFGMGIDKRNVRSVVHASAPGSLESYVQEIGRAGRDGEVSYCRVLYNPYDFYALRCRLWTSLLSPQEFHAIVLAIFSNPITQFGEKIMLVSVQKISQQLSIAEETVETILFMLLTSKDAALRGAFKGMRGSCPLGYRVSHPTHERVEAAYDPCTVGSANPSMDPSSSAFFPSSSFPSRRKRARKGGEAPPSAEGSGAVVQLLAQLQADDPVVDIFNRHDVVANQIEAANAARMSWEEFTFRCADLIAHATTTLTLSRISSAYVIELGPSFAELASPAGVARISRLLFDEYDTRLSAQVEALGRLFAILQAPTHEGIYRALEDDPSSDGVAGKTANGGDSNAEAAWQPPACTLTRVEAVSLANRFVEENLSRLSSTYEAARCLLGVMPKSLIKHGKYAGLVPLSHNWYVRSPYFGRLREFDWRWVLAVLAPHELDKVGETNPHSVGAV